MEWVSTGLLEELGISSATIYRKTARGLWRFRTTPQTGHGGRPGKEVCLKDLPEDIQTAYHQRALSEASASENSESATSVESDPEPLIPPKSDRLRMLRVALSRFPLDERPAWEAELLRLGRLIERYNSINPKRVKNPRTNKLEFVPEVLALCEEAACTDGLILSREPSRAQCPSPHTLDGWSRRFKQDGLATFLKKNNATRTTQTDRRKAEISPAAVEWVNSHWRNYRSPRALYKALKQRAKKEGWIIPSETWLYRKWSNLPNPVKTVHLQGQKAYVSKWAMHVPRDYSDLDALQILCGDHSQRKLHVLLKDGTLARPWLTLWLDLRTYLAWGWHIDLVPSSYTVGMAYANGVRTFGAQPLSRPNEGYFSYWYTDQGKDYKSHNFDGTITVHKQAFNLDGGIEVLRVQQQVGYLNDLEIKRILARGYNAREKPVERFHRDITTWEENTFDEYCGRDTEDRPDAWRKMYTDHQRFVRGKRSESPFIGIDEYIEALNGFLHKANATEHERTVLGGVRQVPIEEFQRLYTTRYEISEEALALLLMRAEKRIIRKNGVRCTGTPANWYYHHPAMNQFKGKDVEVRYSQGDYSRVWVFLPDSQICEAELITPTSIINPNKHTLGRVAEESARERKLIREHQLLTFSMLRGETTEDRVAEQFEEQYIEEAIAAEGGGGRGSVQKLTRMDAPKLRAVKQKPVSVEQIAETEADESIFEVPDRGRVKLFDYPDEFEEE